MVCSVRVPSLTHTHTHHNNARTHTQNRYLFRRLKCVHVYECLSHGRQWWFSLHLTTDTRYTLRDMQISTQPRNNGPDPYWWKHGAGHPCVLAVGWSSLCSSLSGGG